MPKVSVIILTYDNFNKLFDYQLIPHGGTMFRRNKYGGYDEEFSYAADWPLMIRTALNGAKFHHISELFLWNHRVGHNQLTGNKNIDIECKIIKNKYAKFRKN
jgi:hypothetical protein